MAVIPKFTQRILMKFTSLQPFVPSGSNFEGTKEFLQELGFEVRWDGGDYVGYNRDGCMFILRKYDNKEFAENFMLSVRVTDLDAFYKQVTDKNLAGRFGVRIGTISQQPYGRELNIIDLAGVCWHFIQE